MAKGKYYTPEFKEQAVKMWSAWTALAVVQRDQGAVARTVAVAGHDRLRRRAPLLVRGRRMTWTRQPSPGQHPRSLA